MDGMSFEIGFVLVMLIIYIINEYINHRKYNAKEARKYVEKLHKHDIKRATKNALRDIHSSIGRNMRHKKYEVSVNIGEDFYKANPTVEEVKILIDKVKKELLKENFSIRFITGEDSKVIICNISW